MMTMDELRTIIARIPNKRGCADGLAGLVASGVTPEVAALWNWLVSELRAADDRERAALTEALDGIPLVFDSGEADR